MGPAEGQSQWITARAFRRGQMGIGAIGIDLNGAVEAVEDFSGVSKSVSVYSIVTCRH